MGEDLGSSRASFLQTILGLRISGHFGQLEFKACWDTSEACKTAFVSQFDVFLTILLPTF